MPQGCPIGGPQGGAFLINWRARASQHQFPLSLEVSDQFKDEYIAFFEGLDPPIVRSRDHARYALASANPNKKDKQKVGACISIVSQK